MNKRQRKKALKKRLKQLQSFILDSINTKVPEVTVVYCPKLDVVKLKDWSSNE